MEKLVIGWIICIIALVSFLPAQVTYEEHNGLAVLEIESVPAAAGWVKRTAVDGYTGSGYYTWNVGTSSSITAAGQGVLTYRVKINNPGTYNLRLHSYHNCPEDQTLENDCWLKVDNGSWIKLFQNGSNAGYWNFVCKLEPSHGVFENAVYDLSAGYHTIQISGRSYNFSIDRINLYQLSMVSRALSTGHPESPREGVAISGDLLPVVSAPAAGTVLQQGQTYTLIGSGPMLFWKYDLDADGSGITSLSIKDTATYKVPEIAGLEKIAFHLYSSFKTEVVTFDVIPASAIKDGRQLSDVSRSLRAVDGIIRLSAGSVDGSMNVYSPAGTMVSSVPFRNGEASWSGAGHPAGLYLVGVADGQNENIIPVVLTK